MAGKLLQIGPWDVGNGRAWRQRIPDDANDAPGERRRADMKNHFAAHFHRRLGRGEPTVDYNCVCVARLERASLDNIHSEELSGYWQCHHGEVDQSGYSGEPHPDCSNLTNGELRQLEDENRRLKKLLADSALEIDALKLIASGNF